jgi:hypothetical protein
MPSASTTRGVHLSLTTSTSSGFGYTSPSNFVPADKTLINQWTLTQFYENSLNPSVSPSEQDEYSRYVEHPLNLPLVVSTETPSPDDPSALEFYEYLSMTEDCVPPLGPAQPDSLVGHDAPAFPRPASSAGFSVNIPFSHHSTHDTVPLSSVSGAGGNKFQVSEEDIEEFEEYLKVDDNPLDVLEEDGAKKRYKAYRQWLRGKSFFKQSKVDPEWQNQLPVR